MKIRLTGTPEEVDRAAEKLQRSFRVVSFSPHYRCRGGGEQVNVYAEVRL